MAWVIFFIISFLLFVILVSVRHWKGFWSAGIVTMIIIYLIDKKLIELGAYSLKYGTSMLSGLPVFYWLGSFFGGILLAYFYPKKTKWQIPYTLLMSGLFVIMELIMFWLGYFYYHKWNPVNSLILNFIGFTAVLKISQYIGVDLGE